MSAPGSPQGLALLQAVARRDLAGVHAALEEPTALVGCSGFNALHVAALEEFPEAVQPLVAAGEPSMLPPPPPPLPGEGAPDWRCGLELCDWLPPAAGVDINAQLANSYGSSAEALPEGLALDGLPERWRFGRYTALSAALFMGHLRTAEVLLTVGARQVADYASGGAWQVLTSILHAHPGEEGLRRERAAAALLLPCGLPAEWDAVHEAHGEAARLAWPLRQPDPEDPWPVSRLLQAHLQTAGNQGGGGQQAGEGCASSPRRRRTRKLCCTCMARVKFCRPQSTAWISRPSGPGCACLRCARWAGSACWASCTPWQSASCTGRPACPQPSPSARCWRRWMRQALAEPGVRANLCASLLAATGRLRAAQLRQLSPA